VCEPRGVSALVYRAPDATPRLWGLTAEAIVRMEQGNLHANAARDFAIQLRQYKFADPVLGVVSAYLYDSINDVDSIRQMAFYYIDNGLPVPFDIALLAQVESEMRNGQRWIHIPDVAARAPATGRERDFDWTYAATPAADGPVAGCWPWMRQGWALLEELRGVTSTLVHPDLLELLSHVRPARFTTLDATGGRRLAELLLLTPRPATPAA